MNASSSEKAGAGMVADGDFSHAIIGAAVEVQRVLGTGLIDSAYAAALAVEFNELELAFVRDQPFEALYKGRSLGLALRADFVVEGHVLVAIRTADAQADVQRAQLLTCLRTSGLALGLLINFQTFPVVKGIHRVENRP